VGVDPAGTADEVAQVLAHVFGASAVDVPDLPQVGPVGQDMGRGGCHTESFSRLLAEMQSVARAHPAGRW
jgi:ring-1,2-phenylacetyl-CoA epoxidase subunit PaaC